MKLLSRNRGFSLIEVMIALVVIGVGLLALAKFHTEFFRSSSDAAQRTLSLNLAQVLVDDLRSYTALSPASDASVPNQSWATAADDKLVYSFIGSNTGGAEFKGGATSVIDGNTYFISDDKFIKWDVTDVDNRKDITIDVLFFNESGEKNEITLETSIAAYDPNKIALVDDDGGTIGGGSTADRQRTTLIGTAPDVVPIDLGESGESDANGDTGISRQTSKPTPDVSKKGGSVKSTFEVVTYITSSKDSVANTADAFVLENFSTINCQCEKAASVSNNLTPSRTAWFQNDEAILDGLLGGRTGISIPKVYGLSLPGTGSSAYQSQDASCETCCREHHDVTLTDEVYSIYSDADLDGIADPVPDCSSTTDEGCFDPGRSIYISSNHKHFIDNTDSLEDDPYLEACKIKEVSGTEVVMQDWRLLTMNVIPDSYFNTDANITTYSTYVASVVHAYLDGTAIPVFSSIPVADRTVSQGDAIQLSVRAIYLDYLPSTAIDGYEAVMSRSTPLYKIPFYTVNVTKLAGWHLDTSGSWSSPWSSTPDYTLSHQPSANDCNAQASSSPCIENEGVVDELLYTDLNYSRGLMYTNNASAGTLTVGAILYKGNEGLIDRSPVDADATSYANYVENTIDIIIQ